MQIIVVSNLRSKRVDYFVEAGRNLQTAIHFLTYKELIDCLPTLRQAVIKLEPWVSSETNFLQYALWSREYQAVLQQLCNMPIASDVHFMNPPDALLQALDKEVTKRILLAHGVKSTPLLATPHSFDELLMHLAACGRGCFLKPRYGSGAGGVMAIRYHHNRRQWVAYTTLQRADNVIHNTKRIHHLTTEKDIRPLAEAVMQTQAVLEEWVPKEQWQGENYDLRVVCTSSEVLYVVVRCSKGSITNLHLNNNAHRWEELPLSDDVRQQVYLESRKAVQALGLRYAGVDVLIERGTDTPYIIEVNGQGDHIYQDMYARNTIYAQQIKNIQKAI